MASFGLGQVVAGTSDSQSTPNNTGIVDSSTPWMAASEGNLPLLQSALQSLQLPISASDENGYTLLHAAASYNHIGIMQFLLSSQTEANAPGTRLVDAADNDGDTALHYAGGVVAAKFLVETAQINTAIKNSQGKTALQAKQEELEEMIQDEDIEEDDDDLEDLKATVQYLSSLP